jgi:hypothetical protein
VNQRRLRLIVAAGLLLLAAVDFFGRVYVPRHVELRGTGSFAPAAVQAAVPTSRIRKDLATWLPKLRPIADASGPAADSDWALTLLAVFDDRRTRFAVIRANSLGGGGPRISSVVQGDDLYGFKVKRVDPLRVVLSGESGDRELQLFEPGTASVVGAGAAPGPTSGPPSMSTATTAVAASPGSASPPSRPEGTQANPPAAAGPHVVQSRELKPGEGFELPESMRGLKVVDAPTPAKKVEPSAVPPSGGQPPPPKKP